MNEGFPSTKLRISSSDICSNLANAQLWGNAYSGKSSSIRSTGTARSFSRCVQSSSVISEGVTNGGGTAFANAISGNVVNGGHISSSIRFEQAASSAIRKHAIAWPSFLLVRSIDVIKRFRDTSDSIDVVGQAIHPFHLADRKSNTRIGFVRTHVMFTLRFDAVIRKQMTSFAPLLPVFIPSVVAIVKAILESVSYGLMLCLR